MGLDVAFNRAAATAAGMRFQEIPNGTAEENAAASPETDGRGYCDWLKESDLCIQVDGMEYWTDGGRDPEEIVVRANKWGNTYHPLTKFLEANGIPWTEF